jgi:prophage regulatory protein
MTMKLIKFDKVSEKCGGLSKSTIYRRMKRGQFPKSRRVGGRVFWVAEEVDDWLLEQINTPYEPHPVAIPGTGKRRGRYAKKESDVKISESASSNTIATNSYIERFKYYLLKNRILPPKEIIDDGKLHLIDGSVDKEYYIFKHGYPALGMYDNPKKNIKVIWQYNDKKLKPNCRFFSNISELFCDFDHLSEKYTTKIFPNTKLKLKR